ncbi:MAG: DMT family transporter [Beijerinckiaceae bacterium]|nr:DMT family transporter [Beijerinckiaceae bacterium]MCZ8301639.1 DMT family transporter [Beijerinckiaceae bacterium]
MLQSQKNLRGILMMVLAMACFVLNDTLVKLARVTLEAGQILVIRGIVALVLLMIWLRASGMMRRLGDAAHPKLLARGGIEATIAMSFITALGVMPLADITAILMAAPLIITALSMVLFGEQIGWRRWSAVVVGFGGMLLVVRPGGTGIPLLALVLAIYSVIGVGLRDLLTRRIPMDIPSVVIALTSTLGTLLGGLVLVIATGIWRPFGMTELLYTAGAATFVILGNLAMIEACRDVELSVVSPFRYVVIVWAVLLGIFVFGEWPAPIALLGIALIGASGLYTLHRERVRHREELRAPAPDRG